MWLQAKGGTVGKLTQRSVLAAKPGYGPGGKAVKRSYQDGDGLFLVCAPTGAKSWILRVQVDGTRRDIGLGSLDDGSGRAAFAEGDNRLDDTPLMLRKRLTLAEAREKSAALRKLAKAGSNPVAERDRKRVKVPTFAEARGWRKDALPDARELRSGLAKQTGGKNFASLHFVEVPGFFASELGKGATASRYAVLFAILTGARSGEVREATWEKIDHEARTWTRTVDDMKMKVRHVVTLSPAAVALLERWQPDKALRKGLIFPGTKGKALSDMSLSKALHSAHDAEIKAGRAGYLDPTDGRIATVHGFRASFRDWAAERMPTMPAMVAEMALAHKVGNATEQAYLRSDLRAMRQELMDAWGRFASPALSGVACNVTPLRAGGAA